MRRQVGPTLDRLYAVGAVLGGVCLLTIVGLVVTQVVARWLGISIVGVPELSGYAMANSFFLPLAYAFRKGALIRITLLLDRLSGRPRWGLECIALALGLGLASYLAVFMVRLVYVSYLIGDISQGADSTPLWIPQMGLATGAVLLATALGQALVEHLAGRLEAAGGNQALLPQ